MDPIEKRERKREARRRLSAQRQRAGQLRGRVVAISLIAFALLWGVVLVQMATGNDPVLGDSSSTTAQRSGHGNHRHGPRANAMAAGASAGSEEAPSAGEATETSEPEAVEPEIEPVEEEFVEAEPEFVEPQPEPEPEPAPVTTSQS